MLRLAGAKPLLPRPVVEALALADVDGAALKQSIAAALIEALGWQRDVQANAVMPRKLRITLQPVHHLAADAALLRLRMDKDAGDVRTDDRPRGHDLSVLLRDEDCARRLPLEDPIHRVELLEVPHRPRRVDAGVAGVDRRVDQALDRCDIGALGPAELHLTPHRLRLADRGHAAHF